MARKGKNYADSTDIRQNRMAQIVDDYDEFQKFKRDILPMIRKDLEAGMEADAIQKKYLPYVAAAQLTTALTNPRASTERKDILDRVGGKPTERKEVKHTLEKLTTEEMQAYLKTSLEEMDDTDDEEK